ncbi:MAG TPA: acyltransferase [Ktedonobacteraceae bacterium]|nr:acyltransferase [Ktedonobacteraceae bacterium]
MTTSLNKKILPMNSLLKYIQSPFIWLLNTFRNGNEWIAGRLDGREQTGKKNSIVVLDGVRGVAVLMVIIFHINRVTGDNLWDPKTNPLASSVSTAGGTGVTLFFVLSGFLLFMPFAKTLLFKTDWPLLRVFYMRRVLRIIPAYYVSLFLIILFQYPQYLHRDNFKNLLLFLTFFMDSTRATFRQINGPYWTLATEWQFYMLLPFIALGIAFIVSRVPIKRRLLAVSACLLGIIIWGLFIRFWGLYFLAYPTRTFLVPRSVLNVINFFLFGVTGKYTEDFAVGMFISLCYIYSQHPSTGNKVVQLWKRLSPWLWIGGIIILVFSAMWHFKSDYVWSWPFIPTGMMDVFNWLSEMLLAIGFGACIAALLYGSAALKALFEWPMLRWVGLISFSLYIWHLPLLLLFQSRVLPMFHGLNRLATYSMYWYWAIAVIFPFAFLSYLIVERPWMRLGDRWRVVIEKKHREKLKMREEQVTRQETCIAREAAHTLPQEVVTK